MDAVTLAVALSKAKNYTDSAIASMGNVFNLKGTKATVADLPASGNKLGDVWYVVAKSAGYVWIQDEQQVLRWEELGEGFSIPVKYW